MNSVIVGRKSIKEMFDFEDGDIGRGDKIARVRDCLEGAKRVSEDGAVREAVLFNEF